MRFPLICVFSIAVACCALSGCVVPVFVPPSPPDAATQTPLSAPTSAAAATRSTSVAPTRSTAATPAAPRGSSQRATFDPDAPDFRLFNPCTEIPPTVFQQSSLILRQPSYLTPTQDSCSFDTDTLAYPGVDPLFGVVSLNSSTVSFEDLNRKQMIYDSSPGSPVPNAYTHKIFSHRAFKHCQASVDTPRGSFGVLYVEMSSDRSSEELCDVSLKIMTSIYNKGGLNASF